MAYGHRAHASVVSVPKLLPSYAGLLVEEEVRELSKALTPARPSLAVIGGAKFSTKEPVLERLLADQQHLSEATVNELRDIAGRTHRLANKDNSDAELLAELSDRCAVEAVIEGLKLGEAQSGSFKK